MGVQSPAVQRFFVRVFGELIKRFVCADVKKDELRETDVGVGLGQKVMGGLWEGLYLINQFNLLPMF